MLASDLEPHHAHSGHQLNKLASEHRCNIHRYADDITFSTNEKDFPETIGRLVRGSHDKWVAGDGLLSLVIQGRIQNQSREDPNAAPGLATGHNRVIVNQKLNVPHEYYKRVRAMCHHLFTHGYAYSGDGHDPVSNDTVDGMLTFIHQIRKVRSPDLVVNDPADFFTSDQPGFSKLYGRFLDYCAFHGMLRPTIICEVRQTTSTCCPRSSAWRRNFPF